MTITIPKIDVFEVITFISISSYFLVTFLSWLLLCIGISVGGTGFVKFIDKIKWIFCIALFISPLGFVKCFQNLHPAVAMAMFMCNGLGCAFISFPRV